MTAVVLLIIALASLTLNVYQHAQPPIQKPNNGPTVFQTGLPKIVVGGKGFNYAAWNSSTPNTFTIYNVKFSVWTNTTITNTGGSCYGGVGGYGGYILTFSDGSSENLSACTIGPNPPMSIRLTNHVNPQAGLLVIPSTGTVFFLVSG